MTKKTRLETLVTFLTDGRRTIPEIQQRLEIDSRQTVYNYLNEIPNVEQDDQKRYWIDRTTFITNINLSLDEALWLYLAARRQQRQSWVRRGAALGALSKVAHALRKPMVDRLVDGVQQLEGLDALPAEPERVYQELVKAWANHLMVQLRYRGLGSRRPFEDRVAVYLIEPSPWSDGTYIIGHSNLFNHVVTYKVERVEHAFCTGEEYTIPTTFDQQHYLEQAWGIWRGEGEPTRVRLRFKPGVAARRVRESGWHKSAQLTKLPDGGSELTMEVGEVAELLPWIRGWGADVEVLEPETLRRQVIGEIRGLTRLYQMNQAPSTSLDDTFNAFYGGKNKK